jgi:hypothetical protein
MSAYQGDMSRDSSVGIETDYGLDGTGFDSQQVQEILLHYTASRPALGPLQQLPEALSPGVKRPVCEANHSPPPSA